MRTFLLVCVTLAIALLRILWYPGRPLDWAYHGYEDAAHTWVGILIGLSAASYLAHRMVSRHINSLYVDGGEVYYFFVGRHLVEFSWWCGALGAALTAIEVLMFFIQVGL